MKWLLIVGALMFGLLLYFCAPAQRQIERSELATIPLDQIWAFDMPGTHDVQELEPDKFGEHTRGLPSAERSRLLDESITDQIRVALDKDRPSKGTIAKPGFAVLGTGAEALQGAYDVLVKKKTPDKSFPLGSNVTLVFFSHLCGQYVHLVDVERKRNAIKIQYQFVPHMNADLTWHFALIPVGKLPIGKYGVEIIQLPGGKDKTGHFVGGLSADQARQIVCQPFSFSVTD
jgi:hypothetical protein